MEAMIRLKDVGLSFHGQDGRATEVLRGLDLAIPAGQFVAILGPSGVGKSTLLRVIAGLLPPSAGTIAIEKRSDALLPIAMVFQDARLLPWRKVAANVSFGLEHGSLSAAQRREKAVQALGLVGLSDYAERYPHELSGGQRQRVALARALAVDPDILLMDEPFGALDAMTRETLQDELMRIHATTRKTIVFVTHSIDEAVYLADTVVVIKGSPGKFGTATRVSIERPRRRGSPAVGDMVAMLRAGLDTPDSDVIPWA